MQNKQQHWKTPTKSTEKLLWHKPQVSVFKIYAGFFFILFFLPGLEMSLRITNQWTEREEEAHSSHFRPFWSFKRDLYGKGAYNNIE